MVQQPPLNGGYPLDVPALSSPASHQFVLPVPPSPQTLLAVQPPFGLPATPQGIYSTPHGIYAHISASYTFTGICGPVCRRDCLSTIFSCNANCTFANGRPFLPLAPGSHVGNNDLTGCIRVAGWRHTTEMYCNAH